MKWKPFREPASNFSVRSRGYLPHWIREGATYSVTTRLADSLPKEVAAQLRLDHESRLATLERDRGALSVAQRAQIDLDHLLRVDEALDDGHGSCVLREPAIAAMVVGSLEYFRNERYELEAYVVMPNHVHLVVRPLPGWSLSAILKTFKQRTSRAANRILARSGRLWQPESFDRIVRNERDLDRTVRYVLENPIAAGLGADWPWVWPRSPDDYL